MTVNVDELHTDVMPTASKGQQPPAQSGRERLGAAQERWQESRRVAEQLANRVCAEGFHD